jgi:predicted SAM-dependent methyltransferase
MLAKYPLARTAADSLLGHVGPVLLRRNIARAKQLRIVVGASGTGDPGWIRTDFQYLNLLHSADWRRFFRSDSIDAILAEHVWEHLDPDEGLTAARTCFTFLRPGGYIRVAVPDGLNPDPTYIEYVRPGSPADMGHKTLFTYKTFEELFRKAGFDVRLLEYFDESGQIQLTDWKEQQGTITRAWRFDRKNTSIIIDAFKPT